MVFSKELLKVLEDGNEGNGVLDRRDEGRRGGNLWDNDEDHYIFDKEEKGKLGHLGQREIEQNKGLLV